jgi:hypothetical protein
MTRTVLLIIAVLLFPFAMALVGCSGSAKQSKSNSSTAANENEQSNKVVAPAEANANNAKITAALAELSAEDRALAIAQKVCPVSGELLGEMGAPVKVDVKGQSVFICCEGCQDELLSKPDEYLAKIKK